MTWTTLAGSTIGSAIGISLALGIGALLDRRFRGAPWPWGVLALALAVGVAGGLLFGPVIIPFL